MVITLDAHTAVTPKGKPVVVLIPVAPVVVWVIGVSAVLMHKEGVLDAISTVVPTTVMVPVAFTDPQPPVNGIV
jgi:hypothetical protein